MKRQSVPVLRNDDEGTNMAFAALKHNVDMVTGQHANTQALRPLPATATLAQVITQLNAMLSRIQGDL